MTESNLDIRFTPGQARQRLRAEAERGLRDQPKWLSPMWLYDARGSDLFERITELPEYYPTRAEHEILHTHALDIAEATDAGSLVELGSGSSAKTRLLLDALSKHGTLSEFVPVDVSESALRTAVDALVREYPQLRVHGVVDDFTASLSSLDPPEHGSSGPRCAVPERRMVAILGGTIGNLLPAERAEFYPAVRARLRAGEWLLLGADLVKPAERLVPAYADSRGVTAEFNRNALHVLNRELDADLPVSDFSHVARWNAAHEWVEMRLRAEREIEARVSELGIPVRFAAGEELCTEVSAKFRTQVIAAELSDAGFDLRQWWTDTAGDFAVALACAV